jgi:hypothetical protein
MVGKYNLQVGRRNDPGRKRVTRNERAKRMLRKRKLLVFQAGKHDTGQSFGCIKDNIIYEKVLLLQDFIL